MTRPIPLLLSFALLLCSCSSSVEPVPTANLGEPFWVGVNELRAVPEAGFATRFVEVLEDSRCPTDPLILCIWEGRVRIRIGLTSFVDGESSHELRFMDEPSALMVGRFRIELLDVAPEATAIPPALGGYRVRLRVVSVAPSA